MCGIKKTVFVHAHWRSLPCAKAVVVAAPVAAPLIAPIAALVGCMWVCKKAIDLPEGTAPDYMTPERKARKAEFQRRVRREMREDNK